MTTIDRLRVTWSGGAGGDGVSTFYALPAATTALADLRVFFDSIKGLFPSALTWGFPNSGDQIESTTGGLVGAWTRATAANVTPGLAGVYSGGVGARIRWETGTILFGQRVRGTTYLTGLLSTQYQTDGTLSAACITALQAAADALVTTQDLLIFSRRPAGAGAASTVTAATVPDKVTWLTSRRQ